MLKTSSVFVEQVQVSDAESKGVLLCGFAKKPQLSLETNRTMSNRLFLNSNSSQGFSMWLNRGSKIWMAWGDVYGGGSYEDMLVVLIKGEQKLEEVQRFYMASIISLHDTGDGMKEAEYTIEEDDLYYIGVENFNSQRMVATLKVDVLSMIYDTSEATSICSTNNGPCKLDLLFPDTAYFVLASDDDVTIQALHVELSFVARLIAYFVTVGFVVVITYFILYYLEACDSNRPVEEVARDTETDLMVPRKESTPCTYGSTDGNVTSSLCCSSEDMYDGEICAICYEEVRDCLLIPCGHSATCYTCAQRIMEEENKLCPICRRLIHKAKRLPSP